VISILTPTIEERADLLERARSSVRGLSVEHEHIVVQDGPPRRGCCYPIAEANRQAKFDYRFYLCDDDYLIPEGVEELLRVAIEGDYDWVYGIQGQMHHDGTIYDWVGTDPIAPGATGAFVHHKRTLEIAELGPTSCYAGRNDDLGNDWVMLSAWIGAGTRYRFVPVRTVVHRPG